MYQYSSVVIQSTTILTKASEFLIDQQHDRLNVVIQVSYSST